MTKSIQRYAYQHLVSLDRFDKSIEKVMDAMWIKLGGKNVESLTPLLIGIDVEYRGVSDPVGLFSKFLSHLIKLRDKHFVRFVTDTLWAEEAYNGHILYTFDGPKDERCDVVWTVSAMSNHQVEISIRQCPKAARHELIGDLSKSLKTFVKSPSSNPSPTQMCDTMLTFFRNTDRLYQARYLEENLHVLLTPVESGLGYYPIPISGMSYDDARRYYTRVIACQAGQRMVYPNIFDRDVLVHDMFYIALTMIQATHKFDKNIHSAQERYNAAELLFGMWATYHTGFETSHDLILFHITDTTRHSIHSEIHSMDMMAKYL